MYKLNQVKKRNGALVSFDLLKISNAIKKAFGACGKKVNVDELDRIGALVVNKLVDHGFSIDNNPSVDDVQNLVESSLIDSGFPEVAKEYIIYRHEHEKLRGDKLKLLNTTILDPIAKKFDIQCLKVMASRYLFRDGKNEIKEQPAQLFERVALLVGIGDMLYSPIVFDVKGSVTDNEQNIEDAEIYLKKLDNFDNKFHVGKYYLNKWHFRALIDHYITLARQGKMIFSFKEILQQLAEGKFDEYENKINEYFDIMTSQDFLPNTPTLMNAGGRLGMLSACFVLPMEDDLRKIMKTASDVAVIFQGGGGVGINYSDLREEGSIVASTSGVASGPVSFMEVVNTVTDVVKQGGCIATDSLIRTQDGLAPLGSLLNAPPMYETPLRTGVYTSKGYSIAYASQDNGSSDVYIMKTELGTELKATYNHKIMIVNSKGEFEWKSAMDIKVNDWIVHVIGGHVGRDRLLSVLSEKQHFNCKEIKLPLMTNSELGEILGLYMGDGFKSEINHRIGFSINDNDNILKERIEYLMMSQFGMKATEVREATEEDHSVIYSYQSVLLYKWLEQNGCLKDNSPNAYVPDIILQSSVATVAGFLRGLFEADGTVGINNSVSLSSTSTKLVNHVQQLLFGLGIISRLSQYPRTNNSYGTIPINELVITQKNSLNKFKGLIGFISKNEKLDKIIPLVNNLMSDIIPNQSTKLKDCYTYVGAGTSEGRGKKGGNKMLYRLIEKYIHNRRNLTRQRLKRIMTLCPEINTKHFRDMSSDQYVYSKVISMNTGRVLTADLEVPETSSYVANSILVHNKRRGANMGIIDCNHPDLEKFITRKMTPGVLENFNVSVGVWEDFWKAVTESESGAYMLKSPKDHKPVREVNAHKLLDSIAQSAWGSAEPGLIFFDNVNKYNVFAKARGGPLRATNPCVTGDTLLATEKGWVQIKDVVNTSTKIFYEKGLPASAPKGIIMTRPKEDVYIVELTNGMKIKCTKDHPLLTNHGMVDLNDLKIGDRVKLASFPSFGDIGTLDEGLLTGWIVADGYFTGDKAVLDFYGEKKEVVNTFTDIVNKIIPDGSGKRQQYIVSPVVVKDRDLESLSSTRLKVVLMNKFGMTAENKTMMNNVLLQTTEEFQRGFLKSMFSADGTVNISNKSRASIKVGSISFELLRMVQLMLSNFEIKSTIYLRKKSGIRMLPDSNRNMKEYNCSDYYELYVTAKSIGLFVDKIGFIIKSKTTKIKNYIKTLTRGFYNDDEYTKIKSIAKHGSESVYDVIGSPNHQIGLNGIITSNCGEQSLYPYESCNLGSINLANIVKEKNGVTEFDWLGYEKIIRKTTRFLDNIIDVNNYPIPEIDKASKESRRIGLGVMGVADLLYKLGVPYNSKEGYDLQSLLAEALSYYSMDESVVLAKERGEFPLCSKTDYPDGKLPIAGYYEKEMHYKWDDLISKIKEFGIRNVLTTTVAPTGTLSMLADCSSGMEPTFALSFEKQVTVGKFFYANKILRSMLEERGIYSDELLEKIANNYGSLKGLEEIPKDLQDVFVTAMDIHWADHLMAQGVWQDWIGNAISKTINLPYDATSDDVKASYLLAHDLGLKGITVYRDGSRDKQVLHMAENAKKVFDIIPSDVIHEFTKNHPNEYVRKQILHSVTKVPIEQPISDELVENVFESLPKIDSKKICPTCTAKLFFKEGCCVCIECGYSGCSSG